jgi:hypothetical protein
MRLALTRHPDTPCDALSGIAVDVLGVQSGQLVLRYRATGKISDISVPSFEASGRTDELWRHTCFEAFVRPEPGTAYYEYNIAPSARWATYRFDDYRMGMQIDEDISASLLEFQADRSDLELLAALDMPTTGSAQLGLSAVIEEMSGRKSYWALAHPPGRPDFHHADCFALQIPAASPA